MRIINGLRNIRKEIYYYGNDTYDACGGGDLKVAYKASTFTSSANKIIDFPSTEYPISGFASISDTAHPLVIYQYTNYARSPGYINKNTGEFVKFEASTNYIIGYSYLYYDN